MRQIQEEKLLQSVKCNDFEAVQLILNQGVEINGTDDVGKTALMYACDLGFCDIVKVLLINRFDSKIRDYHGRDACYFAAKNGHKDVLDIIIDHGYTIFDLNLCENFNLPHPNVIFAYLETKAPDENVIVELIRISDDNVLNHVDTLKNTLLHLLVEKGYENAILALIKRGVDKETVDLNQNTLLDLAVSYKYSKIACFLIDHEIPDQSQLLDRTIWSANERHVELLLNAGVEIKLYHLMTAIDIEFSENESSEINLNDTILGKILNHHSDYKESLIEFSLIYAIDTNKTGVINQIWNSGFTRFVDVLINNRVNPSRKTARFLKELVDFDVDLIDGSGLIFLVQAVKESASKFFYYFEKLINKGMDVTDLNYHGISILEIILFYKVGDIARIILQSGIRSEFNEKSDFYHKLKLFVQNKSPNMINQDDSQLKDRSYYIKLTDHYRKTPFHYAIENSDIIIAELFIIEGYLEDKFNWGIVDLSLDRCIANKNNSAFLSRYIESVIKLQNIIKSTDVKSVGELFEIYKLENIYSLNIKLQLLDLASLFNFYGIFIY